MAKKEHTIHQQNINVLMKEIYKFENNLSPPLIDDMFQVWKTNYNLRHFQKFTNTKKNSVKMGLETITYREPQLWNLVPTEIKDAPSLSIFKKKIKSWYCENCPCRLCKTYIGNVGLCNPNTSKLANNINLLMYSVILVCHILLTLDVN